MSNLSSLIRLRKHTVDQKQKFLAGLYRQAETLEKQKQDLKDQLAHERQLLEEQEMLEALAWYGHYAGGVRAQIDIIDKDIKQIENRIDIARADLRQAFGDMKKIEITNERRQKAEQKEEQMKETKELDEIGIAAHTRRHEDD